MQLRSITHPPVDGLTGVRLSRALLGYCLTAVVVITLTPFTFVWPHPIRIMYVGTPGDFVANVLLFAPLGLLFRAARPDADDRHAFGVLLAGVAASAMIELTQVFIPARFASPLDVAANAIGAWGGALAFDRIARDAPADVLLIRRLSLELPVMGLAYLTVPLLWVASASADGQLPQLALLTLPVIFGASLASAVARNRSDPKAAGVTALAIGAATLVGILPGLVRQPGIAIAIAAATAIFARADLGRPAFPRNDRRFERPAIRRAFPFLATWILGCAIMQPSTISDRAAMLRILEFPAAFTLIGYLFAEWHGRETEHDVRLAIAHGLLPAIPLACLTFIPVLQFQSQPHSAALLSPVLSIAATICGATLYTLHRSHIRSLTRSRTASPSQPQPQPQPWPTRSVPSLSPPTPGPCRSLDISRYFPTHRQRRANTMSSRNRDHGFGAWAAFCGPGARFSGRRFRGGRFFDRGDLRYMILRLLADQPMHGYEVMQALEKEAGGWYRPSAGSVYPVLQLLEDQGYVTAADRDGKKVYSITDAGRAFLEENQERVEDVFDRVSGIADRYAGSDMRDLTRSFIRFAQVSFEEAVRRAGDSSELDRLKDILERATREMEEAAAGRRKPAEGQGQA